MCILLYIYAFSVEICFSYACPFICMLLCMYVAFSSYVYSTSLILCALRLYVSSICISPPCIYLLRKYVLLCVYFFHIYISFADVSLRVCVPLYASLRMYPFVCIFPLCVCLFVCVFPPYICLLCVSSVCRCMFFRAYVSFPCLYTVSACMHNVRWADKNA